MFVILTFSQVNKDCFLMRILDKLKPRPPTIDEKIAFGCKYVQIDQPMTGGKVKWSVLEQIAGRWANRLIMNKDIQLPPTCGLAKANITEYEERILVNTACHALDKSGTELYERKVGLIDPGGRFQWAAVELLKYCTTLVVYTQAPMRYDKFCGQMMEVYGAPVFTTDNIKALENCILAVAPQREKQQLPNCTVITLCEANSSNTINNIALLPQQLSCEVPHNLDPIAFAAALWQFGRIGSMIELHGEVCRIDGRLSGIGDCSTLIKLRALSLRSNQNT